MADDHGRSEARAQYEAIVEMVAALDGDDHDGAFQAIMEDPLSVQVRSGWGDPGAEMAPAEYEILLSTGGPAARIVGDLDDSEPETATLEYQDWGTPWTRYCEANQDILLQYARCFYFGD